MVNNPGHGFPLCFHTVEAAHKGHDILLNKIKDKKQFSDRS